MFSGACFLIPVKNFPKVLFPLLEDPIPFAAFQVLIQSEKKQINTPIVFLISHDN
jgi:hypothetical protein